jgi:signal transduction histidine kinase
LNLTLDEEGLPERLYLDQSRLTNILVNIISNAIKFTQKGGIHVYAHWFPDNAPINNDIDIEEDPASGPQRITFPSRLEVIDSPLSLMGPIKEGGKESDKRLENQAISIPMQNHYFLIENL